MHDHIIQGKQSFLKFQGSRYTTIIIWLCTHMILFLSCFSSPVATDTAISKTAVQDSSTSPTTEDLFFESWPDTGIEQRSQLSINYDGTMLSKDDTISFQTPPAGLEETKSIFVVLANHTSSEIALLEEDWLVGNGFESPTNLPSVLPPNQSVVLEITFQSQEFTEAQSHTGYLQLTSDIKLNFKRQFTTTSIGSRISTRKFVG